MADDQKWIALSASQTQGDPSEQALSGVYCAVVTDLGSATVTCQMESGGEWVDTCLLYTSPSPRDRQKSRMPSSA